MPENRKEEILKMLAEKGILKTDCGFLVIEEPLDGLERDLITELGKILQAEREGVENAGSL